MREKNEEQYRFSHWQRQKVERTITMPGKTSLESHY